MHRPHVCEQGAIAGDTITKREVWHGGGSRRPKRSNTIEMHLCNGYLVLKSWFKVTTMLMDGEFVPLRGGLAELGVTLNETSRDEHVGDIEQYICTVKEHMHAIYNTLPFQKIPMQLVIEMAKTAVFWLNAFPVMGGASQDLSPRTIISEQQVDYNHHYRFQFREYVQTHEEHNNSMNPRTVGALAFCPVGNGHRKLLLL